jgi:hypothetical protein
MAMRKVAPAAEPLVRVAEVLAELHGADPRDFVGDAERLAQGLQPRVPVTRDWRNHVCVGWQDAERLLLGMRRDQAEQARERAAVVAAQANPTVLSGLVVGVERPGEAPVYSPALVGRDGNPFEMVRPG